MRILNKHLVKKTFKGIAFYKIESTSIEKTKIVTCSSYQIPNFELTNPKLSECSKASNLFFGEITFFVYFHSFLLLENLFRYINFQT